MLSRLLQNVVKSFKLIFKYYREDAEAEENRLLVSIWTLFTSLFSQTLALLHPYLLATQFWYHFKEVWNYILYQKKLNEANQQCVLFNSALFVLLEFCPPLTEQDVKSITVQPVLLHSWVIPSSLTCLVMVLLANQYLLKNVQSTKLFPLEMGSS